MQQEQNQYSILLSETEKKIVSKVLANAYLDTQRLKKQMKEIGGISEATSKAITTDLYTIEDLKTRFDTAKIDDSPFIEKIKARFGEHLKLYFREEGNEGLKSYHYTAACTLENVLHTFGISESETSEITESIRQEP